MKNKQYTESQIYDEIMAVVRSEKSVNQAALRLKVSAVFLWDVINKRKPVGIEIPSALGYKVRTVYEK